MLVQPDAIQATIAQLQAGAIAVADDVQGINSLTASEDLGDL